MKRDLLNELCRWKVSPTRKPLILRGARQVGKSWLVREFGKTFQSFAELNFEKDKDAKTFFSDNINIPALLEKLSLYSGKKIVQGETLLFLDEIQECENALTALRYFKEECPQLHVIAAGSLIDFALEKMGVPVGRVQFLHLYPFSFGEFLTALEKDDLRTHILNGNVDTPIHNLALELLKNYFWLGGMPAVIQTWLDHKDVSLCQDVQNEIIETYRQDFAKYARRRQIEHVSRVFDSIPVQLGAKFVYSRVDPGININPIKQALSLLEMSQVALPAYHSSAQGLPLGAAINEKKFKIFFFDIGLAQKILGLDLKEWVIKKFQVSNMGAVAEQFAAQEFAAYSPPKAKAKLFYWHKETPSSNAEVDMLTVKNGMIIPVEIKSGVKGGMKSMQLFLNSHPASKFGLKISECPFSSHGNIREIPLYGIEAWTKNPDLFLKHGLE